MLSSMPKILHAPPEILNQNYAPLLKEHPTLQFYFKLCLHQIDQAKEPHEVFITLLNMYLTFPYHNNTQTGRIIEQHDLVIHMRKDALNPEKNIHMVFYWVNESKEKINVGDDLIYLLSAYCSIFPFMNQSLTNPHVKNALTIRDINNIYFNTILKPFFETHKEKSEAKTDEDISQTTSTKLIYLCRQLLKSDINSHPIRDADAYALSLIYKQNQICYSDIPGFCNGDSYGWNKQTVRKEQSCCLIS